MRYRLRTATLLPLFLLIAVSAGAQDPPAATEWTDPSPHRVQYVTVAPEVQLEVLDWGGEGDDLIFLHGLSMNAHVFDNFAPRFMDTFRVRAITRRGHGASSRPDSGYTLERLVKDLRVVLDTLGVRRAILAGHSYAGTEMTRLAALDPDRIIGLIYIDGVQDLTRAPAAMQACPPCPQCKEATRQAFRNPEAFRHTQKQIGPDSTSRPNASLPFSG